MSRHQNSAPVWLFSFVDLAFLLLIAFTQIGPEVDSNTLAVGLIEVPQINTEAKPLGAAETEASWQLRVYPPVPGADATALRTPFELLEPGRADSSDQRQAIGKKIDAEELAAHLRLLRQREVIKPVLAPHRDSRSEDLLIAVGLLEEVWLGNRAVTVRPGHPVAAVALGLEHQ